MTLSSKKFLKWGAIGYGVAVVVAVKRSGQTFSGSALQDAIFDPAGTLAMAIKGPPAGPTIDQQAAAANAALDGMLF